MAARWIPLLLVVAVAGCGGGSGTKTANRTVDDQAVESGIKSSLSTSSAKVTKVSCPSDVPVKAGDTFTCSVTFSNGATGKATVTQKAGRRYSSTLKPGSVQIPGSSVESQIKKDLSAQGVQNATVTCPETIIVKVGTTVTCDVSGASGVAGGTVTYTFSSAEGTVDSSSVKTS